MGNFLSTEYIKDSPRAYVAEGVAYKGELWHCRGRYYVIFKAPSCKYITAGDFGYRATHKRYYWKLAEGVYCWFRFVHSYAVKEELVSVHGRIETLKKFYF